jgi:hypothetical protein
MSDAAAELTRTILPPIDLGESEPEPGDSPLAVSFQTTVLELAKVNRDDARAMIVANGWMTRVMRTSDFARLIEATRPDSPDHPFAGERRAIGTLLLMNQGGHRHAVLHELARVKNGAKRRGQKTVYSNALNLERFVCAGDYDLPLTPILSRHQLLALPFYERLAYLSKLYLDAREDEVVRASEWIAAKLDNESEASRLHFWGNTAALAVFSAGRDLASQARDEAQKSPMASVDRNTQRCLHLSLARELVWRGSPEEALVCAQQYRQISVAMGWSSWDYHEIGAKAGLMIGEPESVKLHVNALRQQLGERGYLQKRFIGKTFQDIESASLRR